MNYTKALLFITSFTIALLFFSCEKGTEPEPPGFGEDFNFSSTDARADWSPNGKQIAYVHGDTLAELTGIFIIDTDGTNKKILIAGASIDSPDWTPDGNWIVFDMNAQIFKIKVNGDSLTQLTFEGRNFSPSASPDGNWISYDSNVDSPNSMNFIWKMKIDGTAKIRIAYEPDNGEIRTPYWSVNNKIIHIRYSQDYFSSEIYEMDHNGENCTRITFNETTDNEPCYSLNKQKILYTSQAEGKPPQIWTIYEDGTNPKQLTTTQGNTCDWSPDGSKIVYTDSRAVSGSLWIMNTDGSEPKQLTFY